MASTEQTRAAQAASFERAADVYERARPSYPDEAVAWLLESAPTAVLDLGAGTGKLTRSLVERVSRVHAVDPSPAMLAQLQTALPQVTTQVGTAEAIPLPDDSVDLITCAQAWHWVDPERAAPQVRRVLRPGGILGLIWNVREESVPWVARLTQIMHPSEAEKYVARDDTAPTDLGDVERLTLRWQRPFDRAGLRDLVSSRSSMITATPQAQQRVLDGVDRLLETDPDLADPAQWQLPYRTEVYRVRVA